METEAGGGAETLFPGPQKNDSENEFQFLMACSRSGQQRPQTLRVQGRGGKIIFLLPFDVLLAGLIIQLAQGRLTREKKTNLIYMYIWGFCENRGPEDKLGS